MPVKVVNATVSDFNANKFRSELPNNKPNFILFLVNRDKPSTSLSCCPEKQSFDSVLLTRKSMVHSTPFRASTCLLFLAMFFASAYSTPDPEDLRLVVSESTTIQLSCGLPVKNSSGSIPGTLMVCERVYIQGLLRFKNLWKFAHTVKVKVSMRNSSSRIPKVEVCFHRNMSLGIGMCPQSQWEKAVIGSWAQSMSSFNHKILDIRTSGSSLKNFEVSIEEEFFLYRIIFLILGVVLMSSASILSKSLVSYYSSSMVIGILLVVLIILFQGMKLLSTGQRSSLRIFLYASAVGLVSFSLHYTFGLLDQVLLEMVNPLTIAAFLGGFIFLIGTWLGFWVVHKFVHQEDGSIDTSIPLFVTWSIRIFATLLILQCSLDPLLATGVLISGIVASSMLRKIFKYRFLCRRLYKNLFKSPKKSPMRSQKYYMLRLDDSDDECTLKTPLLYEDPRFYRPQNKNFMLQSCHSFKSSDVYPSAFHSTPKRRKFSENEWEKFTKDSTKKALEGLVSSPAFRRWLVDHADRIGIASRSS
ncbi:LOW QUALITY PROTEIN: uncharacterized protein LOC120091886 [Benincasa hispida]|uniref:LOW QUALITY PROTEIN: uncharacterized protein LOC120091886 n=1 Tax=Benincasa hispida TaxID=102211 RepID=UPI0019004462|nr:LOW QUALITY PROTEIN: uncharacterized protein LOC120091886 [Benincasa hispida]